MALPKAMKTRRWAHAAEREAVELAEEAEELEMTREEIRRYGGSLRHVPHATRPDAQPDDPHRV